MNSLSRSRALAALISLLAGFLIVAFYFFYVSRGEPADAGSAPQLPDSTAAARGRSAPGPDTNNVGGTVRRTFSSNVTMLPDLEVLKAGVRRGEWQAIAAAGEVDLRCGFFWQGKDFAERNLRPPPAGSTVVSIWQRLFHAEASRCANFSPRGQVAPYTAAVLAAAESAGESIDPRMRRLLLEPGTLSAEHMDQFLDLAAERAADPLETKSVLMSALAHSGGSGAMTVQGARDILSGQRFDGRRREALVSYAVTLLACQRGAPCGPSQSLQIDACLRAYNCDPGMPSDRFIRERLLLPGEREVVDALAAAIDQELRRRGG